MDTYLDLLDTVQTIVKEHGESVLSDQKFWYILCDSYSFTYEYTLKQVYKSCIKDGKVKEILRLKDNKSETEKKIQQSIAHSNYNCKEKEALAAALYSIAVSVSACSISDYKRYILSLRNTPPKNIQNRPLKNPSHVTAQRIPNIGIVPKPDNVSFKSVMETLKGNTGIILIGLLCTAISTLCYGLYLFHGWWMFWVLVLIGIIQILYIFGVYVVIDTTKDTFRKVVISSLATPFCLAFTGNVLLSFVFQSEKFVKSMWHYFSMQPIVKNVSYNISDTTQRLSPDYPASPSIMSVLLLLFLFCLFMYSEKIIRVKVNGKTALLFDYAMIVLALIVFVEIIVIGYPVVL